MTSFFSLQPADLHDTRALLLEAADQFDWREAFVIFIAGWIVVCRALFWAGGATRRFVDGPLQDAIQLSISRTRSWSQTQWAPVAPLAAPLSVAAEAWLGLAQLAWRHSQPHVTPRLERLRDRLRQELLSLLESLVVRMNLALS